jgi:hypothetical protein
VQKRRVLLMHMRDGLDGVGEYLEDLRLGETVLQPRVHHVNDAAA